MPDEPTTTPAPAPAAGAAPATPPAEAARETPGPRVSDAIAALRAVPGDEPTPRQAAAAERTRDGEGRFAGQEVDPARATIKPTEPGEGREPAEGADPEAAAAASPPEAGEEPAAAEPAAPKPAEGEAGGEAEPIVMKLPGRRPGQPDEEWETDSPELAERVSQLRHGYMRGEQYRSAQADLEAREEDYRIATSLLAEEPELFLATKVPKDRRAGVVRLLLLQDEALLKQVVTEIEEWDQEPSKREIAKLRLENEVAAKRQERASARARQEGLKAQVKSINAAIAAYIAPDMDESDAQEFSDAAKDTLVRWIEQHRGVQTFTLDKLPTIITRQLRYFGLKGPVARAGNGRPPAAAGTPRTPASSPDAVAAAREAGSKLKKASSARRAIASAPAGAGNAPAPVVLPKNQTIKERVAALRKATAQA